MGVVIPEEDFKRRLIQKNMQKEYDELYYRYVMRDQTPFENLSLHRILEENRCKIIEFFCMSDHVDNTCIDKGLFLNFLEAIEWDCEFVKDDLLRIIITSSFWFDIYFPESLDEYTLELYENLLECDIINNVRVAEEFMMDGDIIKNRMIDLQDRYYELFEVELLPTEFNN